MPPPLHILGGQFMEMDRLTEHLGNQESVLNTSSPWGRDVQREGQIWEVTSWFSRWKTAFGFLGQYLRS